jgi:hypothetical protein
MRRASDTSSFRWLPNWGHSRYSNHQISGIRVAKVAPEKPNTRYRIIHVSRWLWSVPPQVGRRLRATLTLWPWWVPTCAEVPVKCTGTYWKGPCLNEVIALHVECPVRDATLPRTRRGVVTLPSLFLESAIDHSDDGRPRIGVGETHRYSIGRPTVA